MSHTWPGRAIGLALALLVMSAPGAGAQSLLGQGATVPPAQTLLILIRTTLVALNHANRTGNYTVLRDLGAPSFRTGNTAARLGQIFTKLRARNLDLSPVAIVTPRLSGRASITAQGMLYVKGVFPTRPLQINFELLFQPVAGKWRLFGISVEPVPAPKAAAPKPGKKKRKQKPR